MSETNIEILAILSNDDEITLIATLDMDEPETKPGRKVANRETPHCYQCTCEVKNKRGNFSECLCDECRERLDKERRHQTRLLMESTKFIPGKGYEVVECPEIPGEYTTGATEFPIGAKFTKEELIQMEIGKCLPPGMILVGYGSRYEVGTNGRIKIIREES